jgi:tetratricopeptide (TPR) repeat protein
MLGSTASLGSQQAIQRYEMGISYERSLEIFEALDEFSEAIALDPGNTGILEHYAWLLHTYQFREEAVEGFERLLRQEKDKRAVYLGLGWNEMELGRATRSIGFFSEVYDLTAPRSDVGKAFAEIRARSVQDNKAKIAELQRTIAGDPANVAAEKELFRFYLYQAEWSNAFPLGERLLGVSRDDLPFRFSYYRGLFWAGRLTEAEAVLSSLMADSPDNAYLYYEHGRLLRAMNRLKEAETALAMSLALYPEATKTRRELCEVLALSGRAEEAVSQATAMLRDDETLLDAQLALARAYHFSARCDEAIPSYKQVLTTYPQNAEALSGLAECSVRAGDLAGAEEAVKTWEIARRDDPGLKRVRNDLEKAAASILVQADSFSNSSDYRRLNAGFATKLRSWGGIQPRLGYYYSQFRQSGFSDINRNSFLLEGNAQVSSSLHAAARVGMNVYDDRPDHLNGKLTLGASPFMKTYLSASYSHFDIIDTEPAFGNPLYNYVASIGAVGEEITTDDVSLYLQQMIGDDLMLWGNIAHGSYSDGNEKLTYVLGADYRLSEAPFLHVHYSFFYLDYRDPAPIYREGDAQVAAYFDPDNFRVHTPGIEFSFDLFPSLNLYVADDVSFVVDTDGVANSIACALTYRITKEASLRLDYRHITDVYRHDEDEGDYSAEHFMLSFFHRF